MSYLQAKKKIQSNTISPLYLMLGTEAFIIEDIVHTIIDQVLTPEEKDFNLSVYDIRETPIDIAIEDAETLPFLGGKRIVLIKEPYFLTGQKDDYKIEHDLNRLEQYITNPVSETVVIFIAPYEKLDERKKITKLLKKEAVVIEANPFNDSMMVAWLDEQANEQGVQLTAAAKEKLLELVGVNLTLLSNELFKLSLYVGEAGLIDEEIVLKLVARTMEQDIFALIDYMTQRRIDRALDIFHDLIRKKEEPIKIIALLARQIRMLYQVKELTGRGYAQKQIAGQLKLHPYVVKLASEKGTKLSSKQLLHWLSAIADADYKIKSGQMEKELVVELLLMSFYSVEV